MKTFSKGGNNLNTDLHEQALHRLGMKARLKKLKEEAAELLEAVEHAIESGYLATEIEHAIEELADVVTVGKSIVAHPQAKHVFERKCQDGEAKLATVLLTTGAKA